MEAKDLRYPVLSFREGYVYLADSPAELVTHDRRAFSEYARRIVGGSSIVRVEFWPANTLLRSIRDQ